MKYFPAMQYNPNKSIPFAVSVQKCTKFASPPTPDAQTFAFICTSASARAVWCGCGCRAWGAECNLLCVRRDTIKCSHARACGRGYHYQLSLICVALRLPPETGPSVGGPGAWLSPIANTRSRTHNTHPPSQLCSSARELICTARVRVLKPKQLIVCVCVPATFV